MHHPDVVTDLERINQPECIAPLPERQFHHARPEPGQWLDDVWHSAFRQDSEHPRHFELRPLRKVLETPPRSLEPVYRAGISH